MTQNRAADFQNPVMELDDASLSAVAGGMSHGNLKYEWKTEEGEQAIVLPPAETFVARN